MTETTRKNNAPAGKLTILLATGFGLGWSPFASGTTGSLPGILLAAVLAPLVWPWQLGAALALTAAAIPICHRAEAHFGRKDDGRIVADEYLTFPLCLVGLPWTEHVWLLPVAFVVARVMDILKLPPAHQSQRLRGGLGIVTDDAISTLYALGINHLIWFLAVRWGLA